MVRRALYEAGVDSSKLWIVPVPDVHLAYALGKRSRRLHTKIQRSLLQRTLDAQAVYGGRLQSSGLAAV